MHFPCVLTQDLMLVLDWFCTQALALALDSTLDSTLGSENSKK